MNCLVPLLAAALTTISSAAILVQDDFNSLGTGNLSGSLPSTNATGISHLAWQASTTVTNPMKGDGSQGLAVYTTTQTVGFDLGAGYFTTNPGIYRLSVDITFPSSATSLSWIGIGFSQGMNVGENLTHNTNNGSPWAFLRANGSLNSRDLANTGREIATGLTSGPTRRISVELDTSTARWSYRILVDGTQVGTTITYAAGANPETVRYLALSTGVNGVNFTGTLDNFTFEAIPEPSSALLAGAAAGLGLLRRRRNA